MEAARKGVRTALMRSGEHDPQRVLEQISSSSPIIDDLVSELTIGETYFFRDAAQFAVIRHELLPALIRLKGPDHRVRVWSAGCASGEEPYSIAMLLHEVRMLEHSHILATDISHHALARARSARFRSWSLRGSENPLLKRFLLDDQGTYIVDDQIRNHVVFEYLNLALDTYPSFATGTWGLDLILCRNVLIYFNRETIAGVARRFYESLSPGGWLMLGASDPNISEFAPFVTRMTDSGVVYGRPTDAKASTNTFSPEESRFPSDVASPPVVPIANQEGMSFASDPKDSQIRQGNQGHIAAGIDQPDRGGDGKPNKSGIDQTLAIEVKQIREIANLDAEQAERRCAEAMVRHPISIELRFLYAVLLLELERYAEAVEAARSVVFLDRELAIAHMTLGTALQRTSQNSAARRAFRNAFQLCADRPANEIVPFSDGEHAGRLALSAKQHLALLDGE